MYNIFMRLFYFFFLLVNFCGIWIVLECDMFFIVYSVRFLFFYFKGVNIFEFYFGIWSFIWLRIDVGFFIFFECYYYLGWF